MSSAEYQRAWKARNPERVAAYAERHRPAQRLKRYGLTTGDLSIMFQAQHGACAACDATEHGGKNWHIDHCHHTGVVRGILCHKCNVALGMLGDDPERVAKLYRYLTEGF